MRRQKTRNRRKNDAEPQPVFEPSSRAAAEAKEWRWSFAFLAAAVLALWLLPARSSFWLDETATFWVIKDGIGAALTRPMFWSGQSPLYYLTAWLAFLAGGRNEFVLRLPSLAAMTAAALLLYKLARRLFDRDTAVLAVCVFLCSEQIAFAAADARPYALGVFFVIATGLMLVEWLDSQLMRHAAAYSLCAALTIYTHYLLAPVLALFAVYGAYQIRSRGLRSFRVLGAAWAMSAVLILPLATQFMAFYKKRGGLSFADTPTLGDLLGGLLPPALAIPIAISVLAAWFLRRPSLKTSGSEAANVGLAAAWASVPPLLYFLVSIFTEAKVFVPRYYIAAAPGLALFAGWLIRKTTDGALRRIAAVAIFAAALVSFGRTFHTSESWADAMRTVRSIAGDSDMPVLMASGFVESADPGALEDPKLREVLFAPLTMYPPGGRIIRLPFRLDRNSIPVLERVLAKDLEGQSRFLFVGRLYGMTFEPWLRERLAVRGYRSQFVAGFGNIGIYLFRADGS
jgi:hypothetical protein